MRTVSLEHESPEFTHLFAVAKQEPVLLLAADGQEFILTPADNFEEEVEALRNSPTFQTFLEERMKCTKRIPLEEIEREIHEELHWQEVKDAIASAPHAGLVG
jgi:PHD/YefM family antitoxin component YafN of YafNO toxin-antitoxin module